MSAKKIGLITAVSVIVGNSVGSGIFTTSGFLARDIGDPVTILLMWIVAGGIVLCGVLTYYRLYLKWPESGGEFIYISKRFGPLAGFLSGWTSFTFGFGAAIAASAISFGYFLDGALSSYLNIGSEDVVGYLSNGGDIGSGFVVINPIVVSVVLISIITLLHTVSLSISGRVQFYLTLIKVLVIVSIFFMGFYIIYDDYNSQRYTIYGGLFIDNFVNGSVNDDVSIFDMAIGMVFIMYAYSGWNAINYISEEIENPKENMLKAMVFSVAIIVFLYVFLNFIYFSSLSIEVLSAEPIVPVAEKSLRALLGNGVSIIFSLILCVSIMSSISAMVWVAPRVYLKMSKYNDRVPNFVGKENKNSIPINSMFAQSTWAVLICLSGTVEEILIYSGFPLLIFSALAVFSSFGNRFSGESKLSYFLYSFCSFAFIVFVFFAMVMVFIEKPYISALSIFTVLLGVLFYYFREIKSFAFCFYNK
ncbi:APC family permease [Pseudoalteromonas aurantia]|uniref:Amino acid permease n=1 Tax=Pseudoalteromonas aurantia 208 TaxID=1314867 RepID=A0ABR9EES5_9GAMM|nr:amino acid permease [Pseudoalteromonas aurantia]MBE0369479.1 hypothetical protein [Pseudoalteromonas aurantia 208]